MRRYTWHDLIAPVVGGIIGTIVILYSPLIPTLNSILPQKVDSRWSGGPDNYSTSLDYMDLHPVCRDALRSYVLTNPNTVAYMCNMVGDIWVTDLIMNEDTP